MLKELNLEKYIKNNYKLDDFEIIKMTNKKEGALGVGSFATVTLARQKHSGQLYALKQIHIRKKNQKIDKENLRREVLIHRHLRNQNIIKFYDLFEDNGKVYVVIEYAQKGNLFTYLHKHKRFSEIEAFKFFFQTLMAVKYMHDKKLVHRDIKPENLLLNEHTNIKLCDFGWSTVRAKHEKMRTFCGTYEYMAPELLAKKSYDYTVDIWALGILLYELMHGYSPFRAQKIQDILKNIMVGKIKFKKRIPQEIKNLVNSILQIDPDKRMRLEDILKHPWMVKYKKLHELENHSYQKNSYRRSLSKRSTAAVHKKKLPNNLSIGTANQENRSIQQRQKAQLFSQNTNSIKTIKKKSSQNLLKSGLILSKSQQQHDQKSKSFRNNLLQSSKQQQKSQTTGKKIFSKKPPFNNLPPTSPQSQYFLQHNALDRFHPQSNNQSRVERSPHRRQEKSPSSRIRVASEYKKRSKIKSKRIFVGSPLQLRKMSSQIFPSTQKKKRSVNNILQKRMLSPPKSPRQEAFSIDFSYSKPYARKGALQGENSVSDKKSLIQKKYDQLLRNFCQIQSKKKGQLQDNQGDNHQQKSSYNGQNIEISDFNTKSPKNMKILDFKKVVEFEKKKTTFSLLDFNEFKKDIKTLEIRTARVPKEISIHKNSSPRRIMTISKNSSSISNLLRVNYDEKPPMMMSQEKMSSQESFIQQRRKKNSLQDLLKNARKIRKVQKPPNLRHSKMKRYNSQCQFSNFKNLLQEKSLSILNRSSNKQSEHNQTSQRNIILYSNKDRQKRQRQQSKIKYRYKQRPNRKKIFQNSKSFMIPTNDIKKQFGRTLVTEKQTRMNQGQNTAQDLLPSKSVNQENQKFSFARSFFQKTRSAKVKNQDSNRPRREKSLFRDISDENSKGQSKPKFQFFDEETNRIIAKYIKSSDQSSSGIGSTTVSGGSTIQTTRTPSVRTRSPSNFSLNKLMTSSYFKNSRKIRDTLTCSGQEVDNTISNVLQGFQQNSTFQQTKQHQSPLKSRIQNFKRKYSLKKSENNFQQTVQKASQITPRKGVKQNNFVSAKKSLENFSSGFTAQKSKESSRNVLNLKDMNNTKNQLNSKINHCFGDFYKKLDTFADPSKSINDNVNENFNNNYFDEENLIFQNGIQNHHQDQRY